MMMSDDDDDQMKAEQECWLIIILSSEPDAVDSDVDNSFNIQIQLIATTFVLTIYIDA
jgi:hypothetical protein